MLSPHKEQDDRRDGILTEYGAMTLENDFDTCAETVFAFPSRWVAPARNSPLAVRKLGLVFDAYERLDPRLRETFTRQGMDGLRGDGSFHGDVGVSASPV
jgi:hypothetical protein